MYSEAKLALFIYLWYPKIKVTQVFHNLCVTYVFLGLNNYWRSYVRRLILFQGTGYVYETLLRPFVSKHETDIDKSLEEMRAKIWDLAIYYYYNCTELGQTKFFQVIEYLAGGKISRPSSEVLSLFPPLLYPGFDNMLDKGCHLYILRML